MDVRQRRSVPAADAATSGRGAEQPHATRTIATGGVARTRLLPCTTSRCVCAMLMHMVVRQRCCCQCPKGNRQLPGEAKLYACAEIEHSTSL